MTLLFFVSKDIKGLEWPPDNSHETIAALEICRKLWTAFNSQTMLYSLIANLHQPSADLVILTEHGIGVVELKHYFGKVTIGADGAWYAGRTRIQSGSSNFGFNNPHQQVQRYAQDIRNKLVNSSTKNWLPGRKSDWPLFKFQTAVCFTHPDVYIELLKEEVRRTNPFKLCPWEEFSLLTTEDIPAWTAALRFEVSKGYQEGFEPNRLTPQAILGIAQNLLNAKEWSEISKLMPSGDPYAYLTLTDKGQQIHIFPLDQEKVLIGRNQENCFVIIPNQYSKVSRVHCQVTRTAEGIYIEDLKSTNGTYVDGIRIQKKKLCNNEHSITLGGSDGSDLICTFTFRLRDQSDTEIPSTYHQESY